MEPTESSTKNLPESDWVYFGEPTDTEPKQIIEPPLEQIHEDDWAWLLSYKTDEWLELTVHEVREGKTPHEVEALARRQRTFACVKSMYDQGIPPSGWEGRMPHDAAKYTVLNKRCSAAQKAFLQNVASGEITIPFPDPEDEAEAHRNFC